MYLNVLLQCVSATRGGLRATNIAKSLAAALVQSVHLDCYYDGQIKKKRAGF